MQMGWIKTRVTRIGVGLVDTTTKVEEPAGFKGARLTPAGQSCPHRTRFTIPRRGRTVFATRKEAEAANA